MLWQKHKREAQVYDPDFQTLGFQEWVTRLVNSYAKNGWRIFQVHETKSDDNPRVKVVFWMEDENSEFRMFEYKREAQVYDPDFQTLSFQEWITKVVDRNYAGWEIFQVHENEDDLDVGAILWMENEVF